MFLRSLRLDRDEPLPNEYPFTVPAVSSLDGIEFRTPVTLFAGENGSGKSTLIEAIAAAAHSIPVRRADSETERTLAPSAALAGRFRLQWTQRSRRGFFLRGEDFFEFAKGMTAAVADLDDLAADFGTSLEGYGRSLAVGAALGQRDALIRRYGTDLNERSHGEGFLQFFGGRLTGPGLYLLDEPDTALSPQSVLGLIALLQETVRNGAQLIIATHSPILLAFPGATILSFDTGSVREVEYDDIEGVRLLRSFLHDPHAFLRRL